MLLCQLKYLSIFILTFFLIHCHISPFQRRDKGDDPGNCSGKRRCGYTNHTDENNDEYDNDEYDNDDEKHLSHSFFYLLNETGETVIVSYSGGSENIKKSIGDNQCMFFHINDLRFLKLTPSRCLWNCPTDHMGCRYCPIDPGFYVMNLESFPEDRIPSMYSGFQKTGRQAGHSSCSRFR